VWKIKNKSGRVLTEALKNADIAVINYESFIKQHPRIVAAGFGPQMLIMDEASKIKGQTNIAAALKEVADNTPLVYGLTGTPTQKDEQYYPYIHLINPLLCGRSYTRWRDEWFNQGYTGFDYILKTKKRQQLWSCLSQISRAVKLDDVVDLPDAVFRVVDVHLSGAERKAYNQMNKELQAIIDQRGDDAHAEMMAGEDDPTTVTAVHAAAKKLKLRQITSGFVMDAEEDTDKVDIHRIGVSRLSALSTLLDEIGNHQIIIWQEFQEEAKMIAELLKDRRVSYGMNNGLISTSESERNRFLFKNGEIDILIANGQSTGHGVTLTNCSRNIYYSRGESNERWVQTQHRTRRKGQKRAVINWLMIAKNTVDEAIHEGLLAGVDANEKVFEYIKAYGGRL